MKASTLEVCLIQSDICWKEVETNLLHYRNILQNLDKKPNVLIFPEMFNTGFAVDTTLLAETIDGQSVHFLKECAKKYDAAVVASLALQENNDYFNALLWVTPDDCIQRYDKRHLFSIASESELFTAGKSSLLVEYKGWKFMPLICYDLRFPIWSRNKRNNNDLAYDCLIYIANWPSGRIGVYKTLLAARAIENQSYAIGVNRVGKDGNHLVYNGQSQAVNFFGQVIAQAGEKEQILSVTLSKDDLDNYRKRFPVYLDWDE
ncbi:MAG TPA: nitrilase-related carbon-nitrogen hydrolase [Bacteroidales bacterium]|nr:nitrilase-related carbon-nitrogen hydrolase [Bacteroidales bacterium]HON20484.1 nitrilase-related carbon-nitrogen hydrolase [Bacteroidales bacterium]HOR82852.1 nitrilase-related carbon-nitrogen hydrolase [Bacteroidales bacterium]HPJ92107.1 nitrilase-related carbon-nitrogen hydrolase [Bacteroidales bacterium]HQB19334.1 nitrilase-related carbon-nitrogen hydrolase [Bacteroidales bacterium]